MLSRNVVAGYSDGTFNPEGCITRAEFAVIIARFSEINSSDGEADKFIDVNGHWAEKYIAALAGSLNGYEDGSFRPDELITRAEAVKIINTVLGRNPNVELIKANMSLYDISFSNIKDHWAYYEIVEASTTHKVSDLH